ncbi:serine/threonine-protein phosphatase [Bacteroidetes/Chlorobi group bacterium Naka2016]|jgi:sigma-B regulation protein RsbU (phosphoserine phosphatase)|nr:MAG: serine/threonine-protein phosphatase [Bacteroidetes/Chlorobi group bacterium Naka2016]
MQEKQTLQQHQRETYKLVEKLISTEFKDPLELLKRLVKEIVDHTGFDITGGRVWEFIPEVMAYELRMQYGSVEKIPENYRIFIADQPFLLDLVKERTITTIETDKLLKEKGIKLYSVTGVGQIIKTKNGKFYKYLLGFNAPEIKPTFAETLTIISSVATVALKNIIDTIERKKIREDLYQAAQIQKNLFPDHYLEFYDYEVYGVCIPDAEVGGDYFDYLQIEEKENEEERLGIVVGDAASKGLSAAIQALFVSGAFRMGWSYSTRMSDLFSRLNKLIYKTFQYERFVTLFYCELTLSSNRLVLYVNAGHCAPIHYRVDSDSIRKLEPTGGLLGILSNQKFRVENIRMHVGDLLVLYTDGITESMDENHNLYGEDRLIEILKKSKDLSAKEIAFSILEDVNKFSAKSDFNDDKTIIVVKRREKY